VADRPEHHYVPILKGKKGEFDALGRLDSGLKSGITPLVEIITVPWDWTNDVPTKSLEDHLGSTVHQLNVGWGNQFPIWLDTLWLDPGDAAGGKPPLEYLFDLARGQIPALPVGGPGRDANHTSSVAAVHSIDGRGAVLRLDPEDLGDPTALTASVTGWLQAVGVTAQEVDLVVDFGAITPALAPTVTLAASTVMPTLPYLEDWRSITLASGGFPVDLISIKTNSVDRVPRCDWTMWTSVSSRHQPRLAAFGDYAISHPELTELDPRVVRPSATIRYTATDYWVIVKGRWAQKYGFDQFNACSATLIALAEWSGPTHCEGCVFIAACAAGGPTGNLTTWRRVGTVHHLTHTAGQLANLP
jgi:hypothetical protein